MMNAIEEKVRNILIQRAIKGRIIEYSELCNVAALPFDMHNPHDRMLIGDLLETISVKEFEAGRPLLSSIVLTANGEEGDGFYKMAEKLGYGEWLKLKKGLTFAADMIKRTFDYWKQNAQI